MSRERLGQDIDPSAQLFYFLLGFPKFTPNRRFVSLLKLVCADHVQKVDGSARPQRVGAHHDHFPAVEGLTELTRLGEQMIEQF
jgi:hypothetical protein